MEYPKILEEFIKEIKAYGIRKTATVSGVSLSTISSWVYHICEPTLCNAQRVADAIGLEFLLFEKE